MMTVLPFTDLLYLMSPGFSMTSYFSGDLRRTGNFVDKKKAHDYNIG